MNRSSRLIGYVWAFVSTAIALAVRLVIDPVLRDRVPYATLYVAVAFSVTRGGLGPGIVSALLGGLAATYFFVPPRHALIPLEGADNQLGVALYFLVVAMLILLAEMQRRAAAAEQNQRLRFETTLSSIGDAVIAMDAEGRITFLNRVAAQLTGWTSSDAHGQPIEKIFDIRNEETGAVAENPVTRSIREGRVAGLANHTVLISKDGKRIPIEDRGAPILDRHGVVSGAVLVFRDISEERTRTAGRRRAEDALAASQRQLQGIIDNTPALVYAFDLEERFVMAIPAPRSCSTPRRNR